MIQIFSLTLAANEAREVAVTGEYFELRNALFSIAMVELLDRSGSVISRLENPEQSDFVKPGRYETIRITNGPTAQTIRHFYGSGDAGSRRTSGLVRIDGASDVSVIDGGKARSLAGGAFSWAHGSAAVVGQYSRVQLFNPVGSGMNAIVKAFKITASGATTFFVQSYQTALAASAGVLPNSKYPGGSIPVSQARNDSAAALIASPILLDYINASGISTIPIVMQEPVIVRPGWGMTIENATQNQRLDASYEWFEQPI